MHVKELNPCRHITLSWQNDRLLRLTPLAESDDGKSRITKFARHGQRRAHHKGALPNHAGWVLDQESFFKTHEFQRSQAYFSCVTSASKHRQSIKMTLPAGLYLEIIFSGTFCKNAEKLSQRIERFLQTNDLEPVGNIYILPLENHWFSCDCEQYVNKIFLKVEDKDTPSLT